MYNIFKPYNLYSKDNNNYVVSSFERSDSLHYTLKVNTNGEPSIYANKYKKTKKGNKSFQIPIEEGNLFYEPLSNLLGENQSITFEDHTLPDKKLRISRKDNFIILTFTNPHNMFNIINIHISEEDMKLFNELLNSLATEFSVIEDMSLKKQMS